MKLSLKITRYLCTAQVLSFFHVVQAGTPAWTFTPSTPTTISVTSNGTGNIQYLITNQSTRNHTLQMTAITGISQDTTSGYCPDPFTLGYQESCTLSLNVTGSAMQNNIVGGPIVCEEKSNGFECYQPSMDSILNITKTTALSVALITSTSGNPAILYGTNMNWLGDLEGEYNILYCAGNGCDINNGGSEQPTGPITSTSMETDPSVWSGYSVAICPATESSYNSTLCSNIFYTP